MSLLSYTELCELVEQGVITDVTPNQINASSIDITLGSMIVVECPPENLNATGVKLLDYRAREQFTRFNYTLLPGEAYNLAPGEFVLAHSAQRFNLPNNISAEYKLKSSMARIGLEHLNAGWCDAGWNGSVLTLELKNMLRHHGISIRASDPIGQMVFFKHAPVPADRSYAARGRYNNDTTVTGIKE